MADKAGDAMKDAGGAAMDKADAMADKATDAVKKAGDKAADAVKDKDSYGSGK